MRALLGWVVLGGVVFVLAGCSQGASVSFPVGCNPNEPMCERPLKFRVTLDENALPEQLRTDDDKIRAVDCNADDDCPSLGRLETFCNQQNACDARPLPIAVPVGDIVDFRRISMNFSALFERIDRIVIERVDYAVQENSLTFGIQDVGMFWGPASASTVDPEMGTRQLGTVPNIKAMEKRQGQVGVDPAGEQALSRFITDRDNPEVRFFVQSTVDLDPGDAWPQGTLDSFVKMNVRAEGNIRK